MWPLVVVRLLVGLLPQRPLGSKRDPCLGAIAGGVVLAFGHPGVALAWAAVLTAAWVRGATGGVVPIVRLERRPTIRRADCR